MAHVTLPLGSSNSGPNRWSDVFDNDSAITDQVNGNLDSDNLAANSVGTSELQDSAVTSAKITDGTIVNADVSASAAIAFSKLAALTSANILVGNGSNVATAVNPAGAVEIDNAGATTIAYASQSQGSATTLPNAGTQTTIDNCTVTPAAGTWVFWAKVRVFAGGGGELLTAQINLVENLTVRDISAEDYGAGTGSQLATTLSVGPTVLTLDGAEPVTLTAGQTGSVSDGTSSHGRLFGLRLA